MCTSSVPCSHVPIALSDSTANTQITVFTVHIVDTRARLIAQPDTKVLDLDWTLLWNFL